MTQLTTWTNPSSSNFNAKEINVSAVFGSPDRRCAGSGLCKLLPAGALGNWSASCPIWPAEMTWESTGVFTLKISLAGRQKERLCSLFQKDFFLMEDPFIFPGWLCKVLEISGTIVPSGKYPLIFQNDVCILRLTWQKGVVEERFLIAGFRKGA